MSNNLELNELRTLYTAQNPRGGGGGGGGGGVLGLKTDGGVPLAAENRTQKEEKIEFGAKKIDFCKNW